MTTSGATPEHSTSCIRLDSVAHAKNYWLGLSLITTTGRAWWSMLLFYVVLVICCSVERSNMNPRQLVSWASTSISPFPAAAVAPGRYCLPAPAARFEAKIPIPTCARTSSIFSRSREGVTPLYLVFCAV